MRKMFLTKDEDGTLTLWYGYHVPQKFEMIKRWFCDTFPTDNIIYVIHGHGDDMKEISWEDETPAEVDYNDERYLKFIDIRKKYEQEFWGNKNELNMWLTRDNVNGLVLHESEPINRFDSWISSNQIMKLNAKLFPSVSVEDDTPTKIKMFISK